MLIAWCFVTSCVVTLGVTWWQNAHDARILWATYAAPAVLALVMLFSFGVVVTLSPKRPAAPAPGEGARSARAFHKRVYGR
jgi:hypothetical protein